MRWKITIEVWPHSTGAGQEADQKACGDRTLYFYTTADDFADAYRFASAVQQGVQSHNRVWKAPIMGIFRND